MWNPLRALSYPSPLGTAAVLSLAALAYLLTMPGAWQVETPLPWDESGHYLEALEFADALRGMERPLLRNALLGPDLYPPLHPVCLGTWMVCFGSEPRAWFAFGLAVWLGTTYLLLRVHPLAALIFVAAPGLGAIAPSLMVEPLANLFLVATLLSTPHRRSADGGSGRLHFVGFGALMLLTLLTKYNVGLPLIPAAIVVVALARDRRYAIAMGCTVLGVLALFALYLTVQTQGWEMFWSFAVNRANSAGMPPLERLAWYFGVFVRGAVVHPMVAGALLALAGTGAVAATIRRRGHAQLPPAAPRIAMASAYVGFALVALSQHAYLLERSLLGPTVALWVILGSVLALAPVRWLRGAVLTCMLIALVLASTGGLTERRKWSEVDYPATLTTLTGLSEEISTELAGEGLVRVVGTFNEFGAGWVKVLHRRAGSRVALGIDAPFPLQAERDRWPSQWDPRYEEIAAQWARDDTRTIVAIEVAPASTFDSPDYAAWNAWKLNLVRAVRESGRFEATRASMTTNGVTITVFRPLGHAAISPHPARTPDGLAPDSRTS